MNDAEALAEINRALDQWFKGEITQIQALSKISHTAGLNRESK